MIALTTESTWSVLVSGDETGGRFSVIEVREPRGAESPRHVHTREDELVYVLEGRVTFDHDGKRLDAPAGTSLFLPRGSEHTFVVQSPEARLLMLLSPAGLEHSLADLAQPSQPLSGELVIERLVTTAARYGVSITGPGLSTLIDPAHPMQGEDAT
jgi:quercetin dioxygenase-like cupin family protein